MPNFEAGEVVANNPPMMNEISEEIGRFMLIPRVQDAHLHFEAYVEDVPATPQGMKLVLDTLISSANYKYRASVLEQLWIEQYVWPDGGTYDWIDDYSHVNPVIVPFNIFPLKPFYSTVENNHKVMLEVNTLKGIGSVKEINCIDRNIFGFPTHFLAWENNSYLGRKILQTMDHRPLGIPGQYCQITCNDLFFSRASVTEYGTSPPICALFLTANPLHAYFPKNRLSSSMTYGKLTFDVRSRYIHPTMVVTNEVYDYSLVIEIRNVY